ncbi:MAG: type II secretion system F family protein, partial [Oscillospiraceae bacterium]
VADEVRMGNPISTAMSKQKFFAPVFISMVRAGEESGGLGETLGKMAEMYELQTDESAKRVTTLMEPLMTVLIAGIVGVVVIAIAIPMLGMLNLVGTVA